MTKHKEREEDIIKKKNSHREEEIELEDLEKDLPSEISAQAESSETAISRGEPSEIPQSESDEGAISQGEEVAENNEQKYLNNWKRAVADFENYKKQQAQAQKEFAKFANLNLIMQILPVIDNFQASTEHIPEDQKNNPWVVGIMHIQKQLEQVLKDNGVEEIEVKEGDEFDPAMHEAVYVDKKEIHPVKSSQGEVAEGEFNGVKKIIMKGYRIDGKVIRAAKVVVG